MSHRTIITRTEIDGILAAAQRDSTAALWRKINPNQLARARGIQTKLRRRAAFVAVSRDALAALLIELHGLTRIQQLTKAIRAGCGQDTNFDAINLAACATLFPLEVR